MRLTRKSIAVPENDIPERYHPLVQAAIEAAIARRAELEAAGTLKGEEALLKEVYQQFMSQMSAAGISEEDFKYDYQTQLGSAVRRILLWTMNLSREHPPTHRKGIGEAGIEQFTMPEDIIFEFGGGAPPAPGGGGGGGTRPGPGQPQPPGPSGFTIPAPQDMVDYFQARWSEMRIEQRTAELVRYGASTEELKELQVGALFTIAAEWYEAGNTYLFLLPKPAGNNFRGFSVDYLLIRKNGAIYERDCMLDAGGRNAKLSLGDFQYSRNQANFAVPFRP